MRKAGLPAIALLAALPLIMGAEAPAKTTWVEVRGADQVRFAEFILHVPPGYRLCLPPSTAPASNGVVIPLDPSVACDQFDQSVDESRWPDRVHFAETVGRATPHRSLEDVAQEICADHGPGPTAVKRVGTMFAGLEAITCVFPPADIVREVTYTYHPVAGHEEFATEPRLELVAHAANAEHGRRMMTAALTGLQLSDPPQR